MRKNKQKTRQTSANCPIWKHPDENSLISRTNIDPSFGFWRSNVSANRQGQSRALENDKSRLPAFVPIHYKMANDSPVNCKPNIELISSPLTAFTTTISSGCRFLANGKLLAKQQVLLLRGGATTPPRHYPRATPIDRERRLTGSVNERRRYRRHPGNVADQT